MGKIRHPGEDEFYEAILSLQTVEDCQLFFEDVCTIKELQDLSQRMDVAYLLDKGMNYQQISKEVNVSTATISRVNKCLAYGSGGYKRALERLNAEGTEED